MRRTTGRMVLAAWLGLAPLAPLAAEEPTLKTTLDQHAATVFVVFSPDGKNLAAHGADRHARIWDLATGKDAPIGDLISDDSLFFSADGKTLILLQGDSFQICDVASGKHAMMRKLLFAVPFSPDGKSLVVEEKGVLKLRTLGTAFDATTGQKDVVLKGALAKTGVVNAALPTTRVYGVYMAFSPDGQTLAVRNKDGDLMLCDVASGKNSAVLPHTSGDWMIFSPDGKTLAAASGPAGAQDLAPKLWDVTTGKQIAPLEGAPADIPVGRLVFSPDGKTLALGSQDQPNDPLATLGPPARRMIISLWDAATGKVLAKIQESSAGLATRGVAPAPVVFSPDGKTLAAPCGDGTVKLYDLGAAKLVGSVKADYRSGQGLFAVFSPDGSLLAITNGGNEIKLWNVPGAKAPGK